MSVAGRCIRASTSLMLSLSLLSTINLEKAHAATVIATGADASICNQEVDVSAGVTAQRISGGDCLISFTQPSVAINWTAPANLFTVNYLVVGGGGGGATGYDSGGGGGGGGGMVLTGNLPISPGSTYLVNVGDRGAGGTNARGNYFGTAGSTTSFASVAAAGGQGGYGSRSYLGAFRSGGAAQVGSLTSARGGSGGGGGNGGGGGGGASGIGGMGVTGGAGGSAGAGLTSSFTGSSITFAAGGAGGSSLTIANGASGLDGTGRGGSAGSATSSSSGGGGAGGSGVVYIRYSTTPIAFNSFGLQNGASAAQFRSSATLESNLQAAGRVTFFADGKRIPRCTDIATVGSGSTHIASCNWKPSRKGPTVISVYAKPSADGFANTAFANVAVVNRIGRR